MQGDRKIFSYSYLRRGNVFERMHACVVGVEILFLGALGSVPCSVKMSCVSFSGFVCAVSLCNTYLQHVRRTLENN